MAEGYAKLFRAVVDLSEYRRHHLESDRPEDRHERERREETQKKLDRAQNIFQGARNSPFMLDSSDGQVTRAEVDIAVVGAGLAGTLMYNNIINIVDTTTNPHSHSEYKDFPAINLGVYDPAGEIGGRAYLETAQEGEKLNIPATRIPDLANGHSYSNWGANNLLHEHSSFITANRVGVVASIGQQIKTAEDAGDIKFRKRTIIAIDAIDEGYVLTSEGHTDEKYTHVINATGFETNVRKMNDPLIKQLLEDEIICPHAVVGHDGERYETGLGIDVTHDGRVIDANGDPVVGLSAVGVLTAGNTMVSEYKYIEKYGRGGRLGPFSLNISGIMSTIGPIAESVVRSALYNYESYFKNRLTESMFLEKDAPETEEDDRFINVDKVSLER
jgi:hypothetical protein